MLSIIKKIDYLEEIQAQVKTLSWDSSRITLNNSDGGLLSGNYTIKDEFKNTPIGKFLDSLGNIGEARLLKLESGQSYTAHTDPDDRIHLAVETNPYAYLIDVSHNRLYHVPADGAVYLMDTSKKHLAGNFGGFPRIHINIRVKLPPYRPGGWKLTVSGGGVDWKQDLYIDTMSTINRLIKSHYITGIEKVSERELLINCDDTVLPVISQIVTDRGFDISVTRA